MKPILVKPLIVKNAALIERTAIRNCHVTGLHSFILNETPKIRLYIADENCALRYPFDPANPYLTIHRHKHNDLFVRLTDTPIIHHLYKKTPAGITNDNTMSFNLNSYSRLDDKGIGMPLGNDYLDYIESREAVFLHHSALHTVNIIGNGKCAWIVIEFGIDESFVALSYGGEKVTDDCYAPFHNPVEYIKEYLEL